MDDAFTKPFTQAEMDAMRQAFGARAEKAAGDEARVRRDFWGKLKRVGRRIPFAEDLVAAYYCTLDPATPRGVKLILLAALAYFVLPLDFVADFLPLAGFADDAAFLAAALTQVAGSITDRHREQARQTLQDELEEPVVTP
jgi:uncharacterized membrane protein YkvA (DUF1232 family)